MPKKNNCLSKLSDAVRGTEEPTAPTTVGSPLAGKLIDLSEIDDKMFSAGIMGPGVGIVPTAGELRAPFDGTVKAVFPTGHAVGMESDTGLEVLMHIGIDTVDLQGAHFETLVQGGQRVSAGDLLVRFDPQAIIAAGYSIGTPVVLLNADDWIYEASAPGNVVEFGDVVIRATTVAA